MTNNRSDYGNGDELPASAVEAVATIWRDALHISKLSPSDDFFDLGGDSLLAVSVAASVRSALSIDLPTRALFDAPEFGEFVNVVSGLSPTVQKPRAARLMIPLSEGAGDPIFFVHSLGGEIEYLRPMARLGIDRGIWGVRAVGLNGVQNPLKTVNEMALCYLDEIRRVQRSGPYVLGGYCIGGLVAHAMGALLATAGEQVSLVVIVDAVPVLRPPPDVELSAADFVIRGIGRELRVAQILADSRFRETRSWEELGLVLFQVLRRSSKLADEVTFQEFLRAYDVRRYNAVAQLSYRPSASRLPLALYQSKQFSPPLRPLWRQYGQILESSIVETTHDEIMGDARLLALLAEVLNRIEGGR